MMERLTEMSPFGDVLFVVGLLTLVLAAVLLPVQHLQRRSWDNDPRVVSCRELGGQPLRTRQNGEPPIICVDTLP